MEKKVLFLDEVHPILKSRLIDLGYVCDEDFRCNKEELLNKIASYNGIVIRSRLKIDEEIIEKANQLKFIARSGAGMESIDILVAEKHNITCLNAPEGNRSAVAEHAIGMLLSLFNQMIKADKEVRNGIWKREENRGFEIEGKTFGIIGYGNTGSQLAKRLMGFDCDILVHDKYRTNISELGIGPTSLEEIQEKSDIISFHVPLNVETKHYFDQNFISKLKKDVYLINTSRGPIVETKALVKGLKSGKIKGACLDVLEIENTSFEKLQYSGLEEEIKYIFSSKNCILSPHVAGWTHESYYKLSAILADKIERQFH